MILPSELLNSTSERLLNGLFEMYRQPHRHYHNDWHVYEMFDVALRMQIPLSLEQQIAIAAHDAIYVPGTLHNEELSAALIDIYFPDIDKSIRELAKEIVLATTSHETNIPEAKIVLDLDLLRFSTNYSVFVDHSQNIFYEYEHLIHITDDNARFEQFVKLRQQFLKNFAADHEFIYQTPAFAPLEQKARDNINRYISQ